MGLVYVVVDDSTDKIITGAYTFDRENGGTLEIPHGSSFPVSPQAHELFWKDDEVKLYKRNAGNTAWDAVVSAVAAHATSHQNGGSDELVHDTLDGSGTNTHAQIDSHLGSTSNPHSVTKTQVGLGNVTDDAQLKRAAGDFATFTEKSTPVSADLLLIEDSAAAGAKKKVQVGNLPGGGGGTDVNAIHKNVAAEISTITEKTLAKSDDLVVIEDSEASNAKKRIKVGNLLVSEPNYFDGRAMYFDEFYPPTLNDVWTTSTSGAGSLVDVQLAPGGQVLVRAGNAAGRSAELLFGGGVAWQSLAYNSCIQIRGKYDGTNNGHVEIEVHYADANNYVFVEADWGGNWYLSTRSGGTLTSVDLGVAMDANWHTFMIRAGTSQVNAYIDGVLKGSSTTNIPTASGTVTVYVAATGTGGTKNYLIDGFRYCSDRPT